ncbi:nucleotidyltransferase family protein [Parasynechococcus marenigrum]|uniref:Sugar-phosphate nucleotide transferase n=1 Tax=Parasynechococcus marenigrum (strain WH8102) TaxID=84588 RepID=Q7U909_PARMW|nr:nucleotidyltransferase family protein [Parasynechococcus marenigrum]CAE06965.1 putative sugar-phosphate nucleotide transferase [Parasynechococcus marenigrum WH 8102]
MSQSACSVFDWSKVLISEDLSFNDALKVLSAGGYQIALVQKANGRVAGIVTDSDVRKALLRGVRLDDTVSLVMNTDPKVILSRSIPHDINGLMKNQNVFHLPIVDDQNRFEGLYIAPQLNPKKYNPETIVIMAGGKGKRLMPLTANTPKPMLPVHGKPMLEHILDRLREDGFKNVIISVNYLSERITSYFQDGSKFDMNISYLYEDKPLGTAGALSGLDSKTRENPVIVTNADILSGISYSDLLIYFRRNTSNGLMAVRTQEWQNPFGVVQSNGSHITNIIEKPTHYYQVNAGLYVLDNKLLDLLTPNSYCDMPDLFRMGLEINLNLQVYPLHEQWLDIGRPKDYDIANKES